MPESCFKSRPAPNKQKRGSAIQFPILSTKQKQEHNKQRKNQTNKPTNQTNQTRNNNIKKTDTTEVRVKQQGLRGRWGWGLSHFHCNEPWQMANSRASQSRSQGTIKTSGHCVSLTHLWEIKSPGKHKTGLTSVLFAVILPPLILTPTPSYSPPPISFSSVYLGVTRSLQPRLTCTNTREIQS